MSDSVAIVSGGLDSTTLVYDMLGKGYTPHLLSFDYGQRHSKELQFALLTARRFNLDHDVVDLTGITNLISNSSLTSDQAVPEGHYAEDTMKQTVVPNRNMIMLSIAGGVAVNEQAELIGIGVHAGDHFVYPDCRPRFIEVVNAAIVIGNSGFGPIPEQSEGTMPTKYLYAPFLHKSKADIAYRALELNVPLHLTWSCYKGGEKHCGRCGTCVERLEAIDEARQRIHSTHEHAANCKGCTDHTEYEDVEFWRQAVRQGA